MNKKALLNRLISFQSVKKKKRRRKFHDGKNQQDKLDFLTLFRWVVYLVARYMIISRKFSDRRQFDDSA